MNEKTLSCGKYKKNRLDGVWRDDFDGNMEDELVNSYQEGNKIYLQYYHTKYYDEMGERLKRWWTTVYDVTTGSYLPYKREQQFEGSTTNYTYTPTTVEWTPVPAYC